MTLDFKHLFRRLVTFAVLVVTMLLLVHSARAQTTGQHDYQELCASCHGADGTGKERILTEANPPDLTQLSSKNGGKFPFAEVYRTIDGREMKGSHKRFAMPFWGEYLQQQTVKSTPESDAAIKHRIVGITRYLETIQKK